ncbi:MAG: hypothetical protein KC619_32780 [Myxococcales bacterium]|nr:hypothetical protein [Myxococcales bacterium]
MPTVPPPFAPADMEALLHACDDLAAHYSLAPAPRDRVEEMLADVLVRKVPVLGFREGLITREEARNLVLGHMHSLLIRECNGQESFDHVPNPELDRRVEVALFGAE